MRPSRTTAYGTPQPPVSKGGHGGIPDVPEYRQGARLTTNDPDEGAWQAAVQARLAIFHFIKRRVQCPQTAEDATQEAYVRLLAQATRQVIHNLTGYLFHIAAHLVSDHRRRRTSALHGATPLSDRLACPTPPPDVVIESKQAVALLQQAILELPPRCRQVFLLHKIDQLSYREIAVQLGITTAAVEKHISKALKHCRSRLGR